jgi:hypothetical protein
MSNTEKKHLLISALVSFAVNLIINGLIAWLMYRSRTSMPWAEMWPDIFITVFIIAWIVSVITIASARKALKAGEMAPYEWQKGDRSFLGRLPTSNLRRSTLFAIGLSILFGGLLVGLLALLGVRGMTARGYIVFKALYVGVAAAITSVLMTICELGGGRVATEE